MCLVFVKTHTYTVYTLPSTAVCINFRWHTMTGLRMLEQCQSNVCQCCRANFLYHLYICIEVCVGEPSLKLVLFML